MAQEGSILDAAIRFALATIPENKLRSLFASLGFDRDDEITLSTCVEAWDKFGEEFTKPFFSLAQDQLDNEDKMNEIKRSVIASYSRADGKKGDGSATTKEKSAGSGFDNEKWENAKGVMGFIFGLAQSGYSTYAQAKSDAQTAQIRAQSEAAARQAEIAAQSTTSRLIIIGIGLIVVMIIIVAIVSAVRKK